MASAGAVSSSPACARVATSRTMTTLECSIQVAAAAMTSAISGSPASIWITPLACALT